MTSENGSHHRPRKVGNDLHKALDGDFPRDKRRQFNRIANEKDPRNESLAICVEDLKLIDKLVNSIGVW